MVTGKYGVLFGGWGKREACKPKSDRCFYKEKNCVNSRNCIIIGGTSGADDDAEEENQKRRDYPEGTNVFWTFH